MTYFEGFLAAVPTANKDVYRNHAQEALPVFKRLGANRMVEGWGTDVPRGELNDLYGAVQAKDDETVVFSWIEYPDKSTRDAANKGMMEAPEFENMPEMPFDGQRMIWSGFDVVHEEGPGGRPGYIDGVILPVPEGRKADYLKFCADAAAPFLERGATRVVDGWGDDLMEGKQTDFHRAAHRKDGETVAFGWVEWPDKETRDKGWEALMGDERLSSPDRPFDGKRMMFGGFVPVVDA